MSDFGTFIIATKNEEINFTENEASELSSALKIILQEEDEEGDLNYGNALGEDFNSEFQAEDDSNTAIVILSEHYYGDDDDDDMDFVTETELYQTEEIAEKLALKFPNYTFEAQTDDF